MEDIILTCFGVGIGLIFIFKVLVLISEHLEVKSNYHKLNEYKKELEKENKKQENVINRLRYDNLEVKFELIEIKQRILNEKGYIGEFTTFYGANAPVSVRYDYYVNELDDLKVERKSDGLKEVFELDQKGEIFPTRELAERSLLAKIEKEERAKEELKNKYKEDK